MDHPAIALFMFITKKT